MFSLFFFLLSSFFVFVCFANNNVCCLTFLCVYHCGFRYNELFSIGARSISIERFVCILRQREYFPVVCCVCLNFICIYCASLFWSIFAACYYCFTFPLLAECVPSEGHSFTRAPIRVSVIYMVACFPFLFVLFLLSPSFQCLVGWFHFISFRKIYITCIRF